MKQIENLYLFCVQQHIPFHTNLTVKNLVQSFSRGIHFPSFSLAINYNYILTRGTIEKLTKR